MLSTDCSIHCTIYYVNQTSIWHNMLYKFNMKSMSIILCNNYTAQYCWPSVVPLPVSSQPQLAGFSPASNNPAHTTFLTTRHINLPSTRESPGFPTKNQYVILTLTCPPGSLSCWKVQTMKPHSCTFLQPPVQFQTLFKASCSRTPIIYYCTHLKIQFFLGVKPRRLVKSPTLRRSLVRQS
jgi:hypothetical protein